MENNSNNEVVLNSQSKWKCLIGLHQYKIHKEEYLTDVRGNIIGKIIINRCVHCGKIHDTTIRTTSTY